MGSCETATRESHDGIMGPIIALTLGDIAGIGPEIVAKLLSEGPIGNAAVGG